MKNFRTICIALAVFLNIAYVYLCFSDAKHCLFQGLAACEMYQWLSILYWLSVALLLLGVLFRSERLLEFWYVVIGAFGPLLLLELFWVWISRDCAFSSVVAYG